MSECCQAISFVYAGQHDNAIPLAERILSLRPEDTLNWLFHEALCAAHFARGEYEQSAAAARNALKIRRGFVFPRLFLAASLAELGDLEDARREVDAVIDRLPNFTIESFAYRPLQPEDMAKLQKGLVKAGLV